MRNSSGGLTGRVMQRLLHSGLCRVGRRSYHSFPNPGEVPVISSALASKDKTSNKLPVAHSVYEKFRLDKPFPGVPPTKPIVSSKIPPTRATQLSNGLTVATQEMPGMMSSIAFLVHAGSSYETSKNVGTTHFLELNAFRSTRNRSHLDMITKVEGMGGMVQCIATRENILYCLDAINSNLDQAVDLLADTILHPLFPDEELQETADVIEILRDSQPSDVISRDLVQRAAYQNFPLGNHLYCPLDKTASITAATLHDFRSKYFVGPNCVLSAAGVDHDRLVALATDKFASLPKGAGAVAAPSSKYTGGMLTEQRVLQEPFVKVAMAFEVGGWRSKDLVTVCVIQQLLGGGKSFSSGGPGKGMFTRLYTNVLNRHYWAESVESFVSMHDDHGLLGIDASSPPAFVTNVIQAIVSEIGKLASQKVSDEELNRAKNMLKSSMMMQLESRLVVCEDVGRQILTYGHREAAEDVCMKIDAVSQQDILAVTRKMVLNSPAVSCVGEDISHMPTYDQIASFTKNYIAEQSKSVFV